MMVQNQIALSRIKIRLAVLVLAAVIMLTNWIWPARAWAEAVSGWPSLDVIFVIDDTGSMEQNDPGHLCTKAVMQFVDLLPDDSSQVGVVTYSVGVEKQLKPILITADNDAKAKIKSFIKKSIQQDGAYTDIASGLVAGKKLLDQFKRSNAQPLIILISDGENDLGKNRTQAQSDADLKKVLQSDYPVYTIGLGDKSQSYRMYLSGIANETDGQAYFPKSEKELPTLVKDIQNSFLNREAQGDQISLKKNTTTTYPINVPEGVFEANIQIDYSQQPQIEYINPAGQNVTSTDSGKISCVVEKDYENIKLIKPEAGQWMFKIKGNIDQIIYIDIIFDYQLVAELAAKPAQPQKNDTVALSASIKVSNGHPVSASQLKNLQAVLQITDETDSKLNEEIPMVLKDDRFVTDWTMKKDHPYTLSVIVKDQDMTLASNELKFNQKPGTTGSTTPAGNQSQTASGLQQWVSRFKPVYLLAFLGGVLGIIMLIFILGLIRKSLRNSVLRGNLKVVKYRPNSMHIEQEKFIELTNQKSGSSLGQIMINRGIADIPDSFSQLKLFTTNSTSKIRLVAKAATIQLSATELERNTPVDIETGQARYQLELII